MKFLLANRFGYRHWLSSAALGAAVFISAGHAVAQDEAKADEASEAKVLTIGSTAPALDVEHWVQNGAGAFKPVTDFEKGKVYVVEFWATWCGPCIASMPHLAETQVKYQDRGVQIVSISDEDLETVQEFLKKEAPRQEGKTFDDITGRYCLTTDPDRSVYKDYMDAAGQNGIPTSFIVGKTGLVEWVGHPMEMDEPLEQVVTGKWNRDEFAVAFKAQQAMDAVMTKVFSAMRQDPAKAMEVLNEELAKADSPAMKSGLLNLKFRILAGTGADEKEVIAVAKEILGSLGDDAMQMNEFAWGLVTMSEQGKVTDMAFLKDVAAATEKSAAKAPAAMKWMILDTLAHLQDLTGELDKAIATQKEAVALQGDDADPSTADYLKELEKKKAEGSK